MTDGPGNTNLQPGAQSGIIERKLATILSADVAEFSRLMNEDEEQTLRIFRSHKKILESLVAVHHGCVFNTAGDAILAEFASAVEAVRCATDVQSALRTRNDQLPPNRQVRFRIGINLGDVMIQGGDLLGDGVNVAARLQTAAEPGGISISGSVHDQIRNKLSLSFHELGEKSYKNIPQPVRTFSIAEAEGGIAFPAAKPKKNAEHATIGLFLTFLVATGIAYAGFVVYQHSKDGSSARNIQPLPPAPTAVPSASANPSVAMPGAAPAPPSIQASPAPDVNATGGASSVAGASGSVSRTVSPSQSHSATTQASSGRYDGVYSGQVCYGKTPRLSATCYIARGTVRGHNITGSWPVANEADVTMYLKGEIAPSGGVTLVMHSDRPDGTRVVTINLVGSVRGPLLEAKGQFLRGRSASLNWRLESGALR